MEPSKKTLRIGDLAKNLCVARFVIRFWEKEFGVTPYRSKGGQRFYGQDDMKLFTRIKELLYQEGFTIAGARKLLNTTKSPYKIVGSKKTIIHTIKDSDENKHNVALFFQDLKSLRHKLITLKEKL